MLLPCSSDADVLFSSADTTDIQKIEIIDISNMQSFQFNIRSDFDVNTYQTDATSLITIVANFRV